MDVYDRVMLSPTASNTHGLLPNTPYIIHVVNSDNTCVFLDGVDSAIPTKDLTLACNCPEADLLTDVQTLFMTINEAADLLHITPQAVRQLAKKCTVYTIFGIQVLHVDDVEQLRQNRKKQQYTAAKNRISRLRASGVNPKYCESTPTIHDICAMAHNTDTNVLRKHLATFTRTELLTAIHEDSAPKQPYTRKADLIEQLITQLYE